MSALASLQDAETMGSFDPVVSLVPRSTSVNYHLKKVFADRELSEDSVIPSFRITAADGKSYDTQHNNLSAIIAVGYNVNSERAVQFRKWATSIIDIYATAVDYDVTSEATRRFFATVTNKLHWAIHGQSAAEVIFYRADATKDRMGRTAYRQPMPSV